jgi:hypothetical protein
VSAFVALHGSINRSKLSGYTVVRVPFRKRQAGRTARGFSQRLHRTGRRPKEVWLPDSRRILFGDGGRNFWVVDSQTRQTKKIYSGGRDVMGPPQLTRDGRSAFYSRRISEADIWLMTVK